MLDYPTTFCIYRPFGAGSAEESGLRCRLLEQLDEGRGALAGVMQWTHYLECDATIDIRDGGSREAGSLEFVWTEADADEVRIPDENGTRYIVVCATPIWSGSRMSHKKVLLFRDDPVFTGTGWAP